MAIPPDAFDARFDDYDVSPNDYGTPHEDYSAQLGNYGALLNNHAPPLDDTWNRLPPVVPTMRRSNISFTDCLNQVHGASSVATPAFCGSAFDANLALNQSDIARRPFTELSAMQYPSLQIATPSMLHNTSTVSGATAGHGLDLGPLEAAPDLSNASHSRHFPAHRYSDAGRPSHLSGVTQTGGTLFRPQPVLHDLSRFWNRCVTLAVGPDRLQVYSTYRELFCTYRELQDIISNDLVSWLQFEQANGRVQAIDDTSAASGHGRYSQASELTASTPMLSTTAATSAAPTPISYESHGLGHHIRHPPGADTPNSVLPANQATEEGSHPLMSNTVPPPHTEADDSRTRQDDRYPDAEQCVKIDIPGDDWLAESARIQETAQSFYSALLAPFDPAPSGLDTVMTAEYASAQTRVLEGLRVKLKDHDNRARAREFCVKLAETVVQVNERGIPSNLYAEYVTSRATIYNRRARFATLVCSVRKDAVLKAIKDNKHIARDVVGGRRASRLARDPSSELNLKLTQQK